VKSGSIACYFVVLHLKHLPNVETRFYCPQAFLSLDFQSRDDVSGLKRAVCLPEAAVSKIIIISLCLSVRLSIWQWQPLNWSSYSNRLLGCLETPTMYTCSILHLRAAASGGSYNDR